jgi:putative ABC transport system permease protein
MPDRAWSRLLGSLLPRAVRRDLFEPAIHDLEIEQLRARRRSSFRGRAFLAFLECWRLAPAEVLSMFLHDLRHGVRLLGREPGFAMAAVLTLTLGVGANVAVFAVVNAVLLRPLPYAAADRLVLVEHRDRRTGVTKAFIAIGDFVDLHARQQAFESIAAYDTFRAVIYGPEEPYDAAALAASPELLQMLQVRPALGRSLDAGDARENAPAVIMLGHDLWQTRFAGDPSIIGRSITIGPLQRRVVGVAPRGLRFPANARTEVIMPKTMPVQAPADRKAGWTFAAARLKPGATLEQAAANLTAMSRQMEAEFPAQNHGSEYFAVPLREALVGDTKPALLLLLAAVGLVLLIACANVANLLVARSLGRRQEMAVRVALGAGRRHLVLQLLAESLVLAGLSGAAAIVFAHWATPALVALVPASVNLPQIAPADLDGAVLAFTAMITLLTAVGFSLFTAFGVRIDNAANTIVSPGRVTPAAARRRATSALVVIEIALALVLLAAAGLVLRSFSNLLAVDPGFDPTGVLTINVGLPAERYRDVGARHAFYRQAFDAIRRLPGVQAAGSAAVVPLTGNNWTVPFERADQPVAAGERAPDVGWQSATGGYFRALHIPLRAGRLFGDEDGPDSQPGIIVSEAIQQRYFGGAPAVGRKVKLGSTEMEIVGVVGNIRRAALTDEPRADMYFPMEHAPGNETTLFIRTDDDPSGLVPTLRTTLRAIEPSMVFREIRSMEAVVGESVQVTRLALWLLGLFAATALALAAIGIYAVMSYSVKQRLREIGTRLALGATPGSILWLVLGHGLRIAALGTAIGLGAAWVAGQSIAGFLYGTSPADPAILVGAAMLLLGTALLACYLPARRATRIDPVRTLSA